MESGAPRLRSAGSSLRLVGSAGSGRMRARVPGEVSKGRESLMEAWVTVRQAGGVTSVKAVGGGAVEAGVGAGEEMLAEVGGAYGESGSGGGADAGAAIGGEEGGVAIKEADEIGG